VRRGRVVRGCGYPIKVMVEFILIASASFSAPTGPILLSPNLIDEREREVRRGRVVRGSGYTIEVMVEFILIASASFAAPTGPIFLRPNLIGVKGNMKM
jgi:hypothetical protein